MKTSFELAMERLAKGSPVTKISDDQRKQLAELDSIYAAKIAERELLVTTELEKAYAKGDFEAVEQLKKQLTSDRRSLQADLEEKKEKVRDQK